MICSECGKNKAIMLCRNVENGKETTIGYCQECAKKKGLNPEEFISSQKELLSTDNDKNFKELTSKLENLMGEIATSFSQEDLEAMDGAIQISGIMPIDDMDLDEENSDKLKNTSIHGAAIPLSSMFSSFMNKVNGKDFGTETGNENEIKSNGKTKIKEKKNIKPKKKKFLDTFGTNLTFQARNNEIDNVIGREKEIQRMIQVLNRRSKNNPCLIGEPGVGKTAIAQGLALRIANQNVPAKLLTKEIYLLDLTAVVAGTQFRGQFESRMKGIIDECKEFGNIILVIDEIHNIIGAGDNEKIMNAANILKPALSNGDIQLIGTTTINEYRKYIEKDTALERRFQQILVDAPSTEDAIDILEGIKKYYEDFHKVKISSDIIRKTVLMSEKYIHDRNLPDKAIDILDEACSKINLENKELFKLELLKNELKRVQAEKEIVVAADEAEDYQKAADLKTRECQLIEEIDSLNSTITLTNLTEANIATVIESWTKIPVQKITEAETQKLLNLEANLHNSIVGQSEAVNTVSRAIRRNRAGLQSTKRPPSFIFVGPTGVGKTELAKALAFEMFGNRDSIIRIDMSEYMESHSTSKLIGTPPGYVGYDDAGQLTDKVKRKPYSIILLDEIEKAHPDVFNILLQVLDDGKLTDSHGNTVNFANTIIIMTSNAGSNLNTNSIGFGGDSSIDNSKILDSLKDVFRPEFLNRIDEIISFTPLSTDELLKIIDLMLLDTISALKDKNISITISDNAKSFLLEKGTNIKFGARPLRRAIQRYLEDEIAESILNGSILPGNELLVNCSNQEKLNFKVK